LDSSPLSDTQAEALLDGTTGSSGDLEPIAEVLGSIRASAQPELDADFSALIAVAARESRVTRIERFANEHAAPRTERRAQLVQRVAFSGAAFLLLVGISPGLAYAADGAKPGDLMYGLDRAFEVVGMENGGATERLVEAEALIAAGALADGLRHASAALGANPGTDEARAALTAAAARLEAGADSQGFEAGQVAALIGYLHKAVASGWGVDGQMVAEMAQGLGASQTDPAGPPAEPGSQADPNGPPIEPGSQADPNGPPIEPGSQADPNGPPTEPGRKGK
jgi:hypothetical protein